MSELGRGSEPKLRLRLLSRPATSSVLDSVVATSSVTDSGGGRDGGVDGGDGVDGGGVDGGGSLDRELLWLGDEASALWQSVLFERVLPLLRRRMPEVARRVLGDGDADQHVELSYLGSEPTVNVYTRGGEFKRHRDGEAMTLLILLDDQGFTGGGTEFWRRGAESGGPPTVRLHPNAGVGMIFNGETFHAGTPCACGTRCLLVASFSRTGDMTTLNQTTCRRLRTTDDLERDNEARRARDPAVDAPAPRVRRFSFS